jgi:hypothetical protein
VTGHGAPGANDGNADGLTELTAGLSTARLHPAAATMTNAIAAANQIVRFFIGVDTPPNDCRFRQSLEQAEVRAAIDG